MLSADLTGTPTPQRMWTPATPSLTRAILPVDPGSNRLWSRGMVEFPWEVGGKSGRGKWGVGAFLTLLTYAVNNLEGLVRKWVGGRVGNSHGVLWW